MQATAIDHLRQLPWYNERLLANGRVAIVGCGALGSRVAHHLGANRVGSGSQGLLLFIDKDRWEPKNAATSLFGSQALGQPKAASCAAALQQVNPDLNVASFDQPLEYLGLTSGNVLAQEKINLVLGCLDNGAARLRLNQLCAENGIPYIDAAIDGARLEGHIRHLQAGKNQPCLACLWSQERVQELWARAAHPCAEQIPPHGMASASTIASVIAAMQVHEALFALLGNEHAQQGWEIRFNLQAKKTLKTRIRFNPQCAGWDHSKGV